MLIGYTFIKPVYSIIINYKNLDLSDHKSLGIVSSSYFYPLSFYSELIKHTIEYRKQRNFLNELSNHSPSWDIEDFSPKYQTYVLIIGESMRKDYMSLYNYPIKTTPFLDSVNGLIFNDYYSAAPNTQTSLLRTLYRSNENKIYYSDNIISLAKKVNIKTYWLSNQGMQGDNDTVASRLGAYSDYYYFTKKLGYDSGKQYDEELIPEFKKALENDKNKIKLIVLHLMGSHPAFCERIPYEINSYFINKNMSCYLESVKYTDKFISNIDELLRNSGEKYSVMYFSDHGLAHDEQPIKGLTLKVNNIYKQDYQVPFIIFSSDSKVRKVVEERQSAFNFIHGFSQWLGIKEKKLSKIDFFHPEEVEIKVFDWKNTINIESLADDPAKLPQ